MKWCAVVFAASMAAAAPYRIRPVAGGFVEVSRSTHTVVLKPEFTVLRAVKDPRLAMILSREEIFSVPSWNKNVDLFRAGEVIVVTGAAAKQTPGSIQWTFPARDDFRLEAMVALPSPEAEPVVTFHFTPLHAGWYSVGFTGMPETAPAELDELWQPLVWQERRFPRQSFLSSEHMCPLPAVFITRKNVTTGLVADPREVPFRLPSWRNSRFGVALRNRTGRAQPMIFAPLFGQERSRMAANQTFEFRFRPMIETGGWYDAYQSAGRRLYGFRDYRENGPVSLNETLDNMVEFAMNDTYSGWVADLRGFDYTTDVRDTVKNVSALHPLSVAIVQDDPEIYRRRALPILEYMLSREKYLFAAREGIAHQNPSHAMNGPCAEVSELAALYSMSHNRTGVLRHLAESLSTRSRRLNLEMVSEAGSWQNMLALYRMSGDRAALDQAIARADAYVAQRVARPQTDFADVHVEAGGQFWTDFAPKWVDLLELYEISREKRFLDAALRGARQYTGYCWLQPAIPNRSVKVNPGGLAPLTDFRRNLVDPQPMRAPERLVEAWRLSEVGLTPEAANTYNGNPAIMLTHYAAYFLRAAYYSGDRFLHDLARSAVIGRYANFPGYDINVEYSDVYMRRDFPLRPFQQLTYNNVYYNHVWPHIALLVDYLVSEAFTRSGGAINFPAQYAQGYAYLQSKVYGDREGVFHGDRGVRLWMPRRLLTISDPQVNYISGYGSRTFYVALMNESPRALTVELRLNDDYVPFDAQKTYSVRVWQDGKPAPAAQVRSGKIRIALSPKGMTSIAVDAIPVHTRLQRRYFETAAPLSPASHGEWQTPFGKVTGMLLSMGPSLTSSYVWLQGDERRLREARLVRESGALTDSAYPYEFSFPVQAGQSVRFHIEGVTPDGSRVKSETYELKP